MDGVTISYVWQLHRHDQDVLFLMVNNLGLFLKIEDPKKWKKDFYVKYSILTKILELREVALLFSLSLSLFVCVHTYLHL